MNRERLASFLTAPYPLRLFDSLDSTNSYAKQWAAEGAP
ncbi:MAG: biotin--[acetyl-CoA-carboxylase] ligase, partial [Clostridiales bacterium]|nr:biotin--[acetyl-CoA-carboxylase] ligase [Clostridiales bacterium]